MSLYYKLGIVLDFVDTKQDINPSVLRVLRVFRIARLLKFLNFAKGVRQLVVALIISLPSLLNIGTLLFIIVFIYSIVGMSLFGHVKHQGSINDMENFEDFGNSMLLLFRLTTSAGWNDILESLSIEPPDCEKDFKGLYNGNCGWSSAAIFYLVSYVFLIYLILVNMYIAILLENVSSVHEEDEFVISKATIDNFYEVWDSFAPDGTKTIPYSKLSDFAKTLIKPLKIPKPNTMKLARMQIPLRKGDQVHVFDVMKAVVKRALETEGQLESPQDFDEIVKKMEARFVGRSRSAKYGKKRLKPKEAAAIVIQKAYREHLLAKRQKPFRCVVDQACARKENAVQAEKDVDSIPMKTIQIHEGVVSHYRDVNCVTKPFTNVCASATITSEGKDGKCHVEVREVPEALSSHPTNKDYGNYSEDATTSVLHEKLVTRNSCPTDELRQQKKDIIKIVAFESAV